MDAEGGFEMAEFQEGAGTGNRLGTQISKEESNEF